MTPAAAGASAEEIESVYRLHHVSFLRVASAIAGGPEAGRDAVQEGLARALASGRGFRQAGSVEAWLWKVVVNAARNARRSGQRTVEFTPEAELDADPRAEAVQAAVAALPERQRNVLFLRYYADLDYASIATALGIRRGTVSATLNQAHASMRRLLAEEVPE